ncbi:hypothetical protein AHAS_Ahas06G0181100 [Arachis hypogaea]
METGILFYEFPHSYIYEDQVHRRFYIVAAEPRVRLYMIRAQAFQHPIDSPYFDPDASTSSR